MSKHPLHGLHDIEEFIRSRGEISGCELLYHDRLNRREKHILGEARQKDIPCRQLSEKDFNQQLAHLVKSNISPHILLLAPRTLLDAPNFLTDLWSLLEGEQHPIVLILAGINDQHNLGAIMRSADLFEVSAVILPKRRSATLTDTTRRVSAGASHYVPVFSVANLVRIIDQLKQRNFWVYSSDFGGKSPSELELKGRIAIIMGNEEKGIPHEIKKHVDDVLTIPTGGHIDSCNVSVATGIMLYEARRQAGFSWKKRQY